MLSDYSTQTQILPQYKNHSNNIVQNSQIKNVQVQKESEEMFSITIINYTGIEKKLYTKGIKEIGDHEYIYEVPNDSNEMDSWAVAVYPHKDNKSDVIVHQDIDETFFILRGKARIIVGFGRNAQEYILETGSRITIQSGQVQQVINDTDQELQMAVRCVPPYNPLDHRVLDYANNKIKQLPSIKSRL